VVGIVVVSHSRQLASGIVDLARQMGGEDVMIVAAGGVGEDPDALGTDATIVMEAIKEADSPDGVLVLMDLGSALLSTEMAVELLGDDHEGQVLLCEAPVVEGAVSAATAAKLGRPLEEVADEARGGALAKAEHLGVIPEQPAEAAAGITAPDVELQLSVTNPLGLHARPAARFVQTVGRFDAEVDVTNVTTGRGPKNGRSLNAVATLGVRQGHEILVRASGRQAGAAIEALETLAADNFGDPADDRSREPERVPVPRSATPGLLSGLAASSGVAIGPARRWLRRKPVLTDRSPKSPEAEWSSLEQAIEAARGGIEAARSTTLVRAGADDAAIFEAHLLYLSDDAIIRPAHHAIFDEGRTAERAWDDAVEAVALEYRKLDDDYQRAREADIREVGTAVLEHLLGTSVTPAIEPGVLVVSELGAGDAARLDPEVTSAIATARGGPTSHAAIVAVGLGIPAVVGLGEALLDVPEGTLVIVDGGDGTLHVDPSQETVAEQEERIARMAQEWAAARAAAAEPAVTKDGHVIEVAANAGSVDDAAAIAASGADGIGLLRTEFMFMARADIPTEDEQYKAYSQVAAALHGKSVIVRSLDAGADKPVPYLRQEPEANPFLGERGIRLALARPEVFAAQLRAVLRTAAEHPVKLMFPMVSSVAELRAAREVLDEQKAKLGSEGVPVPTALEVGVMVEVPAAALLAPRLAPEVDFFSIGTNDLSQYSMAADRGNARVAGLADALNPAVLRLVRMVVEAAESQGKWVGICGEIAGNPKATPVLVGLGVRELSMSPGAVPTVKRMVRRLDLESATSLAAAALDLDSAEAVRALLSETEVAGDQ
jgi:phosphoenolpyruvate-protein phosphotransferase/dihydroxyacetone kinase phosphotransfer subunit